MMRLSFSPRFAGSVLTVVGSIVAAGAIAAGAIGAGEPAAAAGAQELTLEKIMSNPDWMGPAVRDAYWSVDGRTAYYSVKRTGSPIVDLHRVGISDGKDQTVEPKAMAGADSPAVFDRDGKRAAFARNGDIFVRDVASGRLTQITRTPEIEAAPQFSADGRLLSFRVNNDWYVHAFAGGVTTPAAVLKTEKDPDAAPKPDDLRDMQLRTFSTLKRLHDDSEITKKYAEDLRKSDTPRAAAPFYLGEDVSIRDTELSSDARWLIAVTIPKSAAKGFEGKLTRYVTESGYEEFETERVRAGRNPPAPQSLVLLNLLDHTVHVLGTDALPGIGDPRRKWHECRAIRSVFGQGLKAQETRGIDIVRRT
jgi:WD40-like Beta Propeller Repeat